MNGGVWVAGMDGWMNGWMDGWMSVTGITYSKGRMKLPLGS